MTEVRQFNIQQTCMDTHDPLARLRFESENRSTHQFWEQGEEIRTLSPGFTCRIKRICSLIYGCLPVRLRNISASRWRYGVPSG